MENVDNLKKYYDFNCDLWKFMKSRLEVLENTEKYWDGTFKAANELLKKHEQRLEERYIRQSINAVINELDRIGKEKELKDGQASIVG